MEKKTVYIKIKVGVRITSLEDGREFVSKNGLCVAELVQVKLGNAYYKLGEKLYRTRSFNVDLVPHAEPACAA